MVQASDVQASAIVSAPGVDKTLTICGKCGVFVMALVRHMRVATMAITCSQLAVLLVLTSLQVTCVLTLSVTIFSRAHRDHCQGC